jgi:hypothetical protein
MMKNKRQFLPLMKGEIKEGVGVPSYLSNHPLNPLLHKEGELKINHNFQSSSRRSTKCQVIF